MMQIDLSMYPEDNEYETETHMIKEGVEGASELASLFNQFANAIGFSYITSVVFYDAKGDEIASSNLF